MQYNIVHHEDQTAVTVFVPGRAPLVAATGHPNLDAIIAGVVKGDESVINLFDVAQTVSTKFERLSERVTVRHGNLYLDGEEMHNSLSEQVLRVLREGEDFKPLVLFYENLLSNPQEHSRDQLYSWLNAEDFTITDDGLIVGYKSVYKNDDGSYCSTMTGHAIVNGEEQNGYITQNLGDVVEMPRNEVVHDPGVACSVGLHVGTHNYAEGYLGDVMLEVRVNPRDVVSVPSDHNGEKMRVCRYTVVQEVEKKYESAILHDDYEDDDYDYDGEDNPEFRNFPAGSDVSTQEPDIAGRFEDETPVADLDDEPKSDESVNVGDTFETTDARRSGTKFRVESIEGDEAVGKSFNGDGTERTRKVKLDRLTSYRYRKV